MSNLLERPREVKWIRYFFKTKELLDPRPLIFNSKYPSWCSGQNDTYSNVVMWLPDTEKITHYFDDAYDIELTVHKKIEFTDRYPKPDYYKD